MTKIGGSVLFALALFAAAPAARAQDTAAGDPAATPAASGAITLDRPWRIGLGVGLGVGGAGGASFLVTQELDYRFAPGDFGAFFLGGQLGEAIGRTAVFHAGVRFGYDFRVFHDAGSGIELLVAPEIVIGGAFADAQGLRGWFDIQLGAEARLILVEGLLGVWLRPLAFDIFIGDATAARYDLLAGASIQI
jgi:hypothetical protein